VVAVGNEAVQALDRALDTWSQQQRGLWEQAGHRLAAARAGIESERRDRRTRVAALESALSAARDERAAARIRAEFDQARRALQRAEAALARAGGAEQEFAAARRRAGFALEPAIDRARRDLARRARSLEAYVSSGGVVAAAPAVAPGRTAAFAVANLQVIDLDEVDFTDNPIAGEFGRGGASRADYRWAVETWETVVRPGLAAGMTRDDFAVRDRERDAPALRRTADVHDMFLNDGAALAVERRADGKLTVHTGRRRITIARELGIRTLPGQVIG
jgi:hypothetical protein